MQTKWLGLYRTVEEAALARDCALVDLGKPTWGGHSKLFNLPEKARAYAKQRIMRGAPPPDHSSGGESSA